MIENSTPFGLTVPGGAAASNFFHEQQLTANLCWAACFRMMQAALRKPMPLEQCAIAGNLFSADCCPNPEPMGPCDRPLPLGLYPRVAGRFGLSASPLNVSIGDVVTALSNGPVQLLFLFDGAGDEGHFVVAVAVDQSGPEPMFAVLDPADNGGFRPVTGHGLMTAYGLGSCEAIFGVQ